MRRALLEHKGGDAGGREAFGVGAVRMGQRAASGEGRGALSC